jgi:hypothetical protein
VHAQNIQRGDTILAPRVYRVRMRCRLDFGTNGLEVTLPDERVTVIEPIKRFDR